MTHSWKDSVPSRADLAIWRDYIETTEAIRAHMARKMLADTGISLGDYTVLLALTEAPDQQLRSSELANKIDWERSRLSHHLRRMEKRGLVRRAECAEDNRGAQVIITAEGRASFRESSIPHLQEIQTLFVDALEPAQLQQLASITARLRESLA